MVQRFTVHRSREVEELVMEVVNVLKLAVTQKLIRIKLEAIKPVETIINKPR